MEFAPFSTGLLQHLSPTERGAVERFFSAVSFAEGSYLYRRGAPADGCFLIEAGKVALEATLPSVGDITTERLGPGDIAGESILLRPSPRTESAKAISAVRAYFVDAQSVSTLKSLLGPPHTQLLQPFAAGLARRLQQFSRLTPIAALAGDSTIPTPALGTAESPGCHFDIAPFLPILPCFKEFSRLDLQQFLAGSSLWEVPRGRKLFSLGEDARMVHFILRGAAETRMPQQPEGRRLQLFGPGRILDPAELVLGIPHNVDCRIREAAVVLTFERTRFERLFDDKHSLATKLLQSATTELLLRLDRVRRMVATRGISLQLNLAM